MGRMGSGRTWMMPALVALGISAPAASAQDYVPPGYSTPQYNGVAGERTGGLGVVGDSNCTNLRNVVIHFGDGTSGPPDSVTTQGTTTTITGSHVYATPADYAGAVDLDATCTNNQGQSYDGHVTGKPGGYPLGFIVHVAAAGAPPVLCSAGSVAARQAGTCDGKPKQRFTDAQKRGFRTMSHVFAAEALVSGIGAAVLTAAPEPALSKVGAAAVGVTAALYGYGSFLFADLYNDPPDMNFAQVRQPRTFPIRHARTGGRLTAPRAAAVNRHLDRLTSTAALEEALLTAIERAQGAAVAHDTPAERHQMLAAADFASRLATAMRSLPATARGAVSAFRAAGTRRAVTAAAVLQAKRRIGAHGLASATTNLLAVFGPRARPIGAELRSGIRTTAAAKLDGRFPEVLAAPGLLTAWAAAAKALDSFAAMARADPLAAAG